MKTDEQSREQIFEQAVNELREGKAEASEQTLEKALDGLSNEKQGAYLEKYYLVLIKLLEENQAEMDKFTNESKNVENEDSRSLIETLKKADNQQRRDIIMAVVNYSAAKTTHTPVMAGLDNYIKISQRIRKWLRPDKFKDKN